MHMYDEKKFNNWSNYTEMMEEWDNQDSDFWLALEKYVIVYGYMLGLWCLM